MSTQVTGVLCALGMSNVTVMDKVPAKASKRGYGVSGTPVAVTMLADG